ncbi:MAG: hypothetical protein J6D29_07340 [Solobacterium sp.]|nr:hypothetical protein [Solobacterium sp.]
MSENRRPRGRKRGEATASGEVHKKEALGAKEKAGNVEAGNRPNQPNENAKGDGNRGLLGDIVGGALNQQQNAQQNFGGMYVRPNQQQYQQRPSYTTTTRRRGGSPLLKILLFIILAFLLISCLTSGLGNSGQTSNVAQPTPVPTVAPTPTPEPTSNSVINASPTGHFVQPTTTYADTNSTALNTNNASGVREKFTKLRGNGSDIATILIYMCGTDLETNYGMGTADLSEIVSANISENVNIIIETGGTKKWNNNIVSNRTNQRYRAVNGGLVPLDQNVGLKAMTDPNTLYDFIQYGVSNFPADRYMLIFWDHGGGSVSGYGYDQNYPNSTMSVDRIAEVLKASNTKFDVIGFDACLMANVETAMAVSPYADYLIASEETEPGMGWYYTNWVNMISQNSSTPTLQLGQRIIDDFVEVSYQNSPRDKISLSMVDLGEFEATVPSALSAFSKEIDNAINTQNFKAIANARSVTKEFAQSNKIDQIDLVHFCANINTTNAVNLANAVGNCVKYNRVYNMKNAYGLSIYFPYNAMNKIRAVSLIYNNIGMSSDYTKAITSFASLASSGQIVNNASSNSIYDLLGGSQVSNGQVYTTEDILSLLMSGASQPSTNSYGSLYDLLGGQVVDSSSVDLFSSILGRNHVDNSNLVFTERDGKYTLALTEDQWALMQNIALNVWVDDGSGYIDLGYDNVFEFDENGSLKADYDGLWISIEDQVVPYYILSEEYPDDTGYVVNGYVPTLMTHTDTQGETVTERVNLLIEFTEDNIDGGIIGGQIVYEEDIDGKNVVFEAGKEYTFQFVADYYDYNGKFNDQYTIGSPITTTIFEDQEVDLEVGTIQLENQPLKYGYVLTDIYNAKHWTPMLNY